MLSRDEILAASRAGPEATVALVEAVVTTLQQEITALSGQVAQLQARLNKDSHNSHKPPSSDGPAKKRPRKHGLRQPSGKKSGGQPGHPGVTRCLVDDPDSVIPYVPVTCAGCGASLETASEISRDRRQVIDVPEPRPEVTEHQAVHKLCPVCQAVTAGTFPPEVTQPVEYGPRAKAAAVYLQTYTCPNCGAGAGQLLPYELTAETLDDLFGVCPSEGTLASAQATAYTRLEPVEQAVRAALRRADVVHVDETSQRVAGRTAWVRVVSTTLLTFYAHHAKRGREAIDAIGLLIGFAGRRVHDAWAPYLSLAGLYALCNVHLLRDLIGVYEDTGQAWAQQLIRLLLLRMKTAVETARAAGQTELPAKQRAGFEAAYTRLLNEGLLANPPSPPTGKRGRTKQTPARNLLERLVTHRGAILAFLNDFRVPFDNNQAERDLRTCEAVKVKSKVSGCFRSPEGADHVRVPHSRLHFDIAQARLFGP